MSNKPINMLCVKKLNALFLYCWFLPEEGVGHNDNYV